MVGKRAWGWWLAAVAPTFLVVQAWQHRWMSDDGFIHLRVVQQLVGGNGPVTNMFRAPPDPLEAEMELCA